MRAAYNLPSTLRARRTCSSSKTWWRSTHIKLTGDEHPRFFESFVRRAHPPAIFNRICIDSLRMKVWQRQTRRCRAQRGPLAWRCGPFSHLRKYHCPCGAAVAALRARGCRFAAAGQTTSGNGPQLWEFYRRQNASWDNGRKVQTLILDKYN